MQTLRLKKGQRGFTLIELMVVMAVLAVLSGIVIGGVTGVSTTSRETVIEADRKIIQSAVDRFYTESDPQLYPIADSGGAADHTTSNTAPSTDVKRTIDFTFPLFENTVATSTIFVPHYLKEVPATTGSVTWQIDFPETLVTYAISSAHPSALQ